MSQARVLWFTGLSGSGKSTIAEGLCQRLLDRGFKVRILDGDDIRESYPKSLGFTPEDIKTNNRLIAQMCLDQTQEYDFLLVPVIAPFQESRSESKKMLGDQLSFVYVKASLDTVIERDTKGFYKKALNKEIEHFIGIDPRVPYEEPENAEIVLDTEQHRVDDLILRVEIFLKLDLNKNETVSNNT